MIKNIVSATLGVVVSLGMAGILHTAVAYADPPGNNGTVKIAEATVVGEEPSNANDPHIDGCSLSVKYFGFDEGARTSTVTFESHAPTPGTLVSPIGPQAVTFTGGGPGDQLDHTATYTLDFQGTPHETQGYHVKVTVVTDGAQGNDTKSKVFWVEGCEPEAVPTSAVSLVCVLNKYTLTVSNTGTVALPLTINGVSTSVAASAPAVTAEFNAGDVLTVLVNGQPATVQGQILNNLTLQTCVGGMGSNGGGGGTTARVSSGFGAGAGSGVASLPVTSGSSAQLASVIVSLGSILAAAGAYVVRSRNSFSM